MILFSEIHPKHDYQFIGTVLQVVPFKIKTKSKTFQCKIVVMTKLAENNISLKKSVYKIDYQIRTCCQIILECCILNENLRNQ